MTLPVSAVNITHELPERPSRAADLRVELEAMNAIAATMGNDPIVTFRLCADLALELCGADTCGISLRERTGDGHDVFRWVALTGLMKDHLHGTTPRFNSPCGVTVDSGAPVLMRRPELAYPYLDIGTPFHDALLIPLPRDEGDIEGTIWIIAHNEDRKFDAEDARLMQRIAFFTSAAARSYPGFGAAAETLPNGSGTQPGSGS